MAYGNKQGQQVGESDAYGAKSQRMDALTTGINSGLDASRSGLAGAQRTMLGLPGQLEAARRAGQQAIRSENAQALGAAGAFGAQQGSGGYGALMQAGLSGGIQSAQFGANSTVDAAKVMLQGNQTLGQMGGALGQQSVEGFNALEEAGGSMAELRQADLAELKSAMADVFAKYDGWYNTDAEEAQFHAAMKSLIASATDPVVRAEAQSLYQQYAKSFGGSGESFKGA